MTAAATVACGASSRALSSAIAPSGAGCGREGSAGAGAVRREQPSQFWHGASNSSSMEPEWGVNSVSFVLPVPASFKESLRA
jgi:hypothetical protein